MPMVMHKVLWSLVNIGLAKGLSPALCQAITETMLTHCHFHPGDKLQWNSKQIIWSPFKKMHIKVPSAKWQPFCLSLNVLTHWGRVTHNNIPSLVQNCLSPGRRQAIIWTNAGILLIRPLGTSFSEILIKIHTFSFNKIHLKMSSEKCQPFCLSLNVLMCEADSSPLADHNFH